MVSIEHDPTLLEPWDKDNYHSIPLIAKHFPGLYSKQITALEYVIQMIERCKTYVDGDYLPEVNRILGKLEGEQTTLKKATGYDGVRIVVEEPR